MDCLINLIGISASDCICVTDGLTEEQKIELKTSVSGLYLDTHLEGGVSLSDVRLLDNCEEYFKMAKDAIKVAERKFADDLMVAISRKYKSTKPKFLGTLGQITYSGNLPVNKKFQYLKVSPKSGSKSSILTVNGVRLITNSDGIVTVRIIAVRKGERNGEEIFSSDLTLLANRFTGVNIAEPLKLPLSANGYELEYYFIWERPEGLSIDPKDNKTTCNCSGGNAFDGYVTLSGGESEDLEDLVSTDKLSHGFSIDAEIKCETGNVICREFNEANEIAKVSAWSILYKAGELLNEYILGSSEISRFTTMNREHLYGKRNHFKKEYEMRIAYLAGEIDLSSSDCFICRENRMFVGNIFG